MAKYLVTGASGGMGSAVCRALCREGHQVWGVDRAACPEDVSWKLIRADMTRPEELEAAFSLVSKEAGELNGLIHTAGVYDLNSLVEMPEADFLRDFNVNLFGMFRVNRLFLPLLAKNSRIVIVSSELAPLHPLPFTGVYAVTKAAVEKYADALRMEVQMLGHRVTVIRPGAVDTPLLPASTRCLDAFCENTRLYPCNAEKFRRIVGRVEARHVPPDKVAGLILKALKAKRPRLTYSINLNPLLRIMNRMPRRLQLRIIRGILKS